MTYTACPGKLFAFILPENKTGYASKFLCVSFTDAAARFVFEPNKSLFNLFKAAGSNSLVQLLFDGTPEVKECYIDSKKDVDR